LRKFWNFSLRKNPLRQSQLIFRFHHNANFHTNFLIASIMVPKISNNNLTHTHYLGLYTRGSIVSPPPPPPWYQEHSTKHHGLGDLSMTKQGVCHTMALPFTLKRQKKSYENSNISPCKCIIIFKKKFSKETQNASRYYNSITNLKLNKHTPKYHLSQILM
jgi:hypothetical protein